MINKEHIAELRKIIDGWYVKDKFKQWDYPYGISLILDSIHTIHTLEEILKKKAK